MLSITSFYAALVALVFLILSARVILYRNRNRLSLGDEGDRELLKRIRAQGNCAEYAPIGLILLALAEVQGAPALAVHALGLTLLAGRAIHGWGFSRSDIALRPRVLGMVLTLIMIGVSAMGLLLHGLI
jgi:uncharacterized membrane protein YecN with MAPEG domain